MVIFIVVAPPPTGMVVAAKVQEAAAGRFAQASWTGWLKPLTGDTPTSRLVVWPVEMVVELTRIMKLTAVGKAGSQTVVRSIGQVPGRINSVKVVDEGSGARAIFDYLVERDLA